MLHLSIREKIKKNNKKKKNNLGKKWKVSMATMLENYRHRFGSAVKAQGNGFNGPCPLCGGEPGKSDRFIIWPDREHDLGHTCAVNHIPGVCYCRQCRFTGDSIKYLMEIEGLSFREACAELGISNTPGSAPSSARSA